MNICEALRARTAAKPGIRRRVVAHGGGPAGGRLGNGVAGEV